MIRLFVRYGTRAMNRRDTDTAVLPDVEEAGFDSLTRGQAPVPKLLTGRLAGMSLPRQVYVLAIWPLLEQAMNFLVGTVDLALAARLQPQQVGLAATDALGVAGYIGWLVGMTQGAVGVGAAALIARAIGGRHKRLANAALGQALILAAITGVLLALGLMAVADLLGLIAGPSPQAVGLCAMYIRIIALAVPLSAVLFVGMAALRAAGDTRTPFGVMVIVNLVNIAASILLVWGPPPIGGHGVAGIAAGTCIAWTVGTAIIIARLLRGGDTLRLRWFRLRPHRQTAWRIVRVGVPQFLESIGIWGANFLVMLFVRQIAGRMADAGQADAGLIGSHMIAIRLESLSFLAGFGVATAAATLMGQYLGADNPRMAKKAALLSWAIGVAIMTVFGVLFLLIPQQLTWLITNQPSQLGLVPKLLFICAWVQPAFATSIVLRMSLSGAGDTRVNMAISYFSSFMVRLPAAYVLGVVMDLGLVGVWYGLCGELLVRAMLFAGRFFHGGWQRVKV